MRFQSTGNKIFIGDSGRSKMTLMRKYDYVMLYLFLLGLVASLAAIYVAMTVYGYSSIKTLPLLAAPLFIIGTLNYIVHKRWLPILCIIAIAVGIYFLWEKSYVLFFLYLFVCTEGVAVMTEVIQRIVFFKILNIIEFVNLKAKLSISDRIMTFMFNIPCDLDTRNLNVDLSVKRDGIPWSDMFHTIFMGLMFSTFLWMYMVFNPSFISGESGMSIYTFTIILYVSLLVLPWNILKSLNVRVQTGYRDFSVFSGLYETIKRMFLPILAVFVFLALSLSSGALSIMYVVMSIIMIAVIVVFTSVLYYTGSEADVIADIKKKWADFHPTSMYAGYREKALTSYDDDVPGTPRRELRLCLSRK